jgi:hypothetical protein
VLAASYRALHDAYREREVLFAAVMADRADWDAATRSQRHLAVAADAEIRRRHPGQRFTPLPLDGQVHPGQALQQPGCPREWPCSRNVVVIAASFGEGSSKGGMRTFVSHSLWRTRRILTGASAGISISVHI